MRLSVAVAVLLVVVVGCMGTTVSALEESEGVVKRFLRFFAVRQPHPLSRVRRQGGSCQTNADCFPSGVNNISSEFVSCVAAQCVCMDCFMSDDDTGRCRICSDYRYDSVLGICGVDNRPRQLTAFLLSLFLSSTGAANFYIGQDGLGAGQLVLLLVSLVGSYALCCLPCCMACCMAKEDMKGSIVFILLLLVFILLVVCSFLAIWAWWIADLVIFATNQRLSGNGCTLTANL